MSNATIRSKRIKKNVGQMAFGFHATGRRLRPTGVIEPVSFVQTDPRKIDLSKPWNPRFPRYLAEGSLPHPTPLLQPTIHLCTAPPAPTAPVYLDKGTVEQGILSSEQLEILGQTLTTWDQVVPGERKKNDDGVARRIRLAQAIVLGTGSGKTSIAFGAMEAVRNSQAAMNEGEPSNLPALIVTTNDLIQNVFRAQAEEMGWDSERIFTLKHANLETFAKIDFAKTPTLLATYAILRRRMNIKTYDALAFLMKRGTDAPWLEYLQALTATADEQREQSFCVRLIDLLMKMMPSGAIYAFDECDGLRVKHSDQHKAYRAIDEADPMARIIFLSASATPDEASIGYLAERLGLVGEEGMYETTEQLVQAANESLTHAEIIIANAVARGTLSTGGLSYEGIQYDTIVTKTTNDQRLLIDAANNALNMLVEYGKARLRAYEKKQYDSADFTVPTASELGTLANLALKHLVTDLSRDALFAAVDASLERGEQVVIELMHTGESQRKAATEGGYEQEATSTKELINQLVRKTALPIKVRVIERDGKKVLIDTNPSSTASITDSFGRIFDSIIERDHVLTQLADRYGFEFAEITGRSVRTSRRNGEFVAEPRAAKKENAKAIEDFNAGRVKVLAISGAGSRGIDLHAASHFESTARRHLMAYDPFQRIEEFVQALGRVCRTGQVSWPKVTFFATDIPAISANLSSIVKKIQTAGACTYGDRQAIQVLAEAADLYSQSGTHAIFRVMKEIYEKKEEPMLVNAVRDVLRTKKNPDGSWYITNANGAYERLASDGVAQAFLRRAMRLPSNDRHPLQQQLWSMIGEAYGRIEYGGAVGSGIERRQVPSLALRPFRAMGMDLTEITITDYGSEDSSGYVRTWEGLLRRLGSHQGDFRRTKDGRVVCFLPNYYAKTYHFYLTPTKTDETKEIFGTKIDADEAKALWDAEVEKQPKHERSMIIAPFPLSGYLQRERQLVEISKADKELVTVTAADVNRDLVNYSDGVNSILGVRIDRYKYAAMQDAHARMSFLSLDEPAPDQVVQMPSTATAAMVTLREVA